MSWNKPARHKIFRPSRVNLVWSQNRFCSVTLPRSLSRRLMKTIHSSRRPRF